MAIEIANTYYFDARCKRCGSIMPTYVGPRDVYTWEEYLEWVEKIMEKPYFADCGKCLLVTVQEVVAITFHPEDEPYGGKKKYAEEGLD